MYFLMIDTSGIVVNVHETWLDTFIADGYAFWLTS